MEAIMAECYKKFYYFFQENTLCDVNLITDDGRRISAHKIILASVISVFYSMFTGSFKESVASDIFIKEMDFEILGMIVKYSYTFNVDIKDETVEKLLQAANLYDIKYAKELCFEHIKENINHDNCVGFMQTSKSISDKNIYSFCWSYFLNNFYIIVNSDIALEKLYELQFDDVVEFIAINDLVVESEDKILDFIIGWVMFNEIERNHLLPELMKHLRLHLISEMGKKRICNDPLMRRNKDLALNIMTEIINIKIDSKYKITFGRTFPNEPNIIFAINGDLESGNSRVMYMDIRNDDNLKWKSSDHLFFCPPRKHAKIVAAENGIILAFGGGIISSGYYVNVVEELDLKSTSKKWVPTTPQNQPRIDFAVCTQKEFIYVVGGHDSFNNLNSVECYNTTSKKWTEIEPMPTARSSCSAIMNDNNLYVFGGLNGSGYLATVECYDFKDKHWKRLDPMPIKNSLMGITRMENVIYLIGGENARQSVFKFDLQNLKWEEMPRMINKMYYGFGIMKKDLFVFGGMCCDVKVFCERYNTEKKQWLLVDTAQGPSDFYSIIYFNDVTLKSYGIPI